MKVTGFYKKTWQLNTTLLLSSAIARAVITHLKRTMTQYLKSLSNLKFSINYYF